jgi:hypothetical protein
VAPSFSGKCGENCSGDFGEMIGKIETDLRPHTSSMKYTSRGLRFIFLAPLLAAIAQAEPRSISGIYPQLAMFNGEGECGTGAVVPWADRLWVVTYAPHAPQGSSDKLYEITPQLEQIIRPESLGGTPADRMIHRESGQLFIGPYAIDAQRQVRAIPSARMFGRLTGLARHLTDPAGKIVFATMEEGIYEVDVKTLAPTSLWADEQVKEGRHADLPGYHGKGFYSAQGRYVYANNGDHAREALSDPAVPSGVLAEWDGKAAAWTVVRRNQFTDVTGPGGIEGSAPDAPLWSIGWDHRSLILMLLDGGKWSSFRLPKASHCYDGAHGWNTEWPRIREIGEHELLMTMHGAFWKFPRTFSAANTAGIAPRSTYVKMVGDFARWGERLVLGCDDTARSEFLNKHPLKGPLVEPGQSQSNLWFLTPAQLDSFGPALGRGAVWLDEPVKAGVASEPFLFSGYAHRSLLLAQDGAAPLSVTVEVDERGDGKWKPLREITVPAKGSAWAEFTEPGVWVRLVPAGTAEHATAMFHYRGNDPRGTSAAPIFDGLGTGTTTRGVLHARGGGFQTLRFVHDGAAYDLDAELRLRAANDTTGAAWTAKNAAIPASGLGADAASAFYLDLKGTRWRLPKGPATEGARVCREVCTERNLLNAFGTFYEMPAENAGGFPKIRPIATHHRAIWDYASYRGLLVMSGVAADARGEHILRSDDGKCALWAGTVDDLWQFGKARGTGGPWRDSAVEAGKPSDPYLCTGYDKKRLTLTSTAAAKIRVEADFTGTGAWREFTAFEVKPGEPLDYTFPSAFGAYWLRLVSDRATSATATFTYE